jgi:hypothetical protein
VAIRMDKLLTTITLLCFSVSVNPAVTENCINEDSLIKKDAEFERLLVEKSLDGITKLLHPNFVWIHNHASRIENSRQELLTFLEDTWTRNPTAQTTRTQYDVKALIHSHTGVVFGFSDVFRNGQTFTYNFMRTYVVESGDCVILSNHTMLIPDS